MSKSFENVVKLNNNPYLDTRWYGTVHDWTTDSTAAFQAAVNAAKNGNIRRIGVAPGVVVTNIDLTSMYDRGIEFFAITRQTQADGFTPATTNDRAATILIKGATSRGFDLTGSGNLLFTNIVFKGLDGDAPLCLVYGSRTPGSGLEQCFGHQFNGCEFLGVSTKAHVYDYAGEGWHFFDCKFSNGRVPETGNPTTTVGGYCFYGTSVNSLGTTSLFQPAIPLTGSGSARPLTWTRFTECIWYVTMNNGAAIWFEGLVRAPGNPDTTVQTIAIDGGYFVCNARTSNSADRLTAASIKLTNCDGTVAIRNVIDESYATARPEGYNTFLRQEGSNSGSPANQQLKRLSIEDSTFFLRQYVIEADHVQGFFAKGNYSWNTPAWKFTNLQQAQHFGLFSNESYDVTTSEAVYVYPLGQAAAANINLGASGFNAALAPLSAASPVAVINPAERGKFAFDRRFMLPYVSVGSQTSVDEFGWEQLGIHRTGTIPTSGNWQFSTIIYQTFPGLSAGNFVGWICTDTGTAGTLNSGATTGSITSGLTALTVNSATGLQIGSQITIAGVSGRKAVTAVNGLVITIDSAADATVSGAAVAYYNPTFTPFGQLNGGTASAADIASIGNAINTTNKIAGKTVWDTTNNRLMRANGPLAGDVWYVIDGSTSVTPS